MPNYVIEQNINFFDELYKSLEHEENDPKDNDECLITNTPLTTHHVQMECGHKFNYLPLFFDLQNHKSMFNLMEGSSSKLAINEIRCPYCRKKQTTLLPYHENLGVPKVNGVNFYDASIKSGTVLCAYQVPSPTFDATLPVSETNVATCDCNAVLSPKLYAPLEGENKYYCIVHKKLMLKKYKEDAKAKAKEVLLLAKAKAKEEKLLAKVQEKEAKKQAKALEKAKQAQAKLQAKEEAKQLAKSQPKPKPKIQSV